MQHTNLLNRPYKGYTQMFTGVRDLGHHRTQSHNCALCGCSHNSYSTGLGKVTMARGSYLESPVNMEVASLASLVLRGSPTKPSIRRCKWPDSREAPLALNSSSAAEYSSTLSWACVLTKRTSDSSNYSFMTIKKGWTPA